MSKDESLVNFRHHSVSASAFHWHAKVATGFLNQKCECHSDITSSFGNDGDDDHKSNNNENSSSKAAYILDC